MTQGGLKKPEQRSVDGRIEYQILRVCRLPHDAVGPDSESVEKSGGYGFRYDGRRQAIATKWSGDRSSSLIRLTAPPHSTVILVNLGRSIGIYKPF